MDHALFAGRFDELVRGALDAAEASPDVKVEDPFLADLVALIQSEPAHIGFATERLCALVDDLQLGNGVVELLEYCMHSLRLQRLTETVLRRMDAERAVLAEGRTLRPWHTVRMCERILEAAQPDWDAAPMYPSLGRP